MLLLAYSHKNEKYLIAIESDINICYITFIEGV